MPDDADDAKKPEAGAEDAAAGQPAIVQAAQADEGEAQLPPVLPVLPSRDVVLFPDMILPLMVASDRDTALVDHVLLENRFLALVPMLNEPEDEPAVEDLHTHGCGGVILKMLRFPDNTVRVLVQGIQRTRIGEYVQRDPFYIAEAEHLEDRVEESVKLDALYRSLHEQFTRLINLLPQVPDEVKVALANINQPGRFADLVAANINLSVEERCRILEAVDVHERLERLCVYLARELQIVELGSKIQEDVKEKINKGQREFFLREQLKAIRKELGEEEDGAVEVQELREALEQAALPEEAAREAERELKRLERMQPGSAEYTVARTYVDWMVSLPWSVETEDQLDVKRARKTLDADHYDLERVKDRIIEFLAVRKVHPEGRSPILCFVGPPGVGKTSLGRSIAEAMGRKFVRISLGGVRDEAEIRGHRRTYIGALPGRIIQGLRKAGSRNPVFMMDEVDKLGSDFRGDPSSALLEVLDPEQNYAFSDHYLDAAFDLSNVIFITTANQLDTVPPALRDRMETLHLPGYSEEEKLQIARRHLVPKVLSEHGLKKSRIRFHKVAIRRVMSDYTREAGLRNLERELASIVRKVAVKIASGKRGPFKITADSVREYLGPPKFFAETARRAEEPGVAVSLAWTPTGGSILFIESTRMAGKKNLQLTGRLGDVIKESAQAALSWIRAHAADLGIPKNFFEGSDIHIHFPEGATPKDGPSAGIALVTSLVSLLTQRRIKPRLATTGEITLRGKVLPVGGIKEKMLAARRAGIKEVIVPQDNQNDLGELPDEVQRDLSFHSVETIQEVVRIAFPETGSRGKRKHKSKRRR